MKEINGVILKNILSIIVAVALTHGIVWADDKENLNYVQISSGVYQPTGDLDDAGYDSGINISGAFGRYFGKHMVLEGGVSFFYSERDFVGSTSAAGFYVEEDTVGILSATATAKGVYPIGKVELFGGAGIGVYFVGFDVDITASNLGNVSTDDEDAVFGFHITGGGNYNITERFFLGGEVKYLWTDDVEIIKLISDIPVRLQGDLNGYTVNITFGFRF